MIENARRVVEETEEVGNEVTQELMRNREKLESTRDKVGYISKYYEALFAINLYIIVFKMCDCSYHHRCRHYQLFT